MVIPLLCLEGYSLSSLGGPCLVQGVGWAATSCLEAYPLSFLRNGWVGTTCPVCSSGSRGGQGGHGPPSVPDKDYLLCTSWHFLVKKNPFNTKTMNFKALFSYFFKKCPASLCSA